MGPEIRQDHLLVGENPKLPETNPKSSGSNPLSADGSDSRPGLAVNPRLTADFFRRDVLDVAPELLGKLLVRRFADGRQMSGRITEVEAYRGAEDLACHASKGRTERNRIMFGTGGCIYMYLIYGMYWMLNIVTGQEAAPQAVLLRGLDSVEGPGRLTREFEIGRDFNGESLADSERLWVEDHPGLVKVESSPRIGIAYAGEYWASRPWRFVMAKEPAP
jgi:DNA-3-methyladenine glycosylase